MERPKVLLTVLCFVLSLHILTNTVQPKYTYIKTITLPEILKGRVTEIIKESDEASGKAFSRKSLRPVSISIGQLTPEKLAESWVTPIFCRVVLSNEVDWLRSQPMLLRSTVLHELGHCFGFLRHSDDPTSVMYYTDSPLINGKSISIFLAELKERANW